jgi:GPH family glycoside/pentoside/hexuronide:cation symporter
VVEPQHAALPPVRRLPLPTMLAYGFGAVAYGVKDFGFITFLLLFYNQVMGLPAHEVGFAIMCALLLDAFIDPLIGVLSDRTRSKWGRRHPWMYASAIPIAIGWLLLWNPPAWSHDWLLAWVFVNAVLVRTAVSSYEVPSQALSPELSADYNERTRIMAFRYLFGWAGGLGMMVVSFAWFLAPGPGQELGHLSRGGYVYFAAGGAVAMVVAILVSAIGTHREIDRLPRPEIVQRSRSEGFREFRQTIANRAFLLLLSAGLCFYVAQGISFSLSQYLYAYVWNFSAATNALVAVALMAGAVGAWAIAPRIARGLGKPVAAMGFMIANSLLLTSPYLMRLAGIFPENESPAMLPLLFLIFAINAACGISSTVLGASMLADVVEHSEIQTGRRSEGVFFAGWFFIRKCSSGLGIFATSMILAAAEFPTSAAPGAVPEATVDRLMMFFCAAYLGLGLSAAVFYRLFPFGRAEHEARIAALAERS